MSKITRKILTAIGVVYTATTFGLMSCVERFPPEVYECLVNCHP